jgi:hypothetical protein
MIPLRQDSPRKCQVPQTLSNNDCCEFTALKVEQLLVLEVCFSWMPLFENFTNSRNGSRIRFIENACEEEKRQTR